MTRKSLRWGGRAVSIFFVLNSIVLMATSQGRVQAQNAPLLLFASETNQPLGSKVIDMSSGSSVLTGRIHCNSDINVSGTGNFFRTGVVENVTGVYPAPDFPGKVTLQQCPVLAGSATGWPVYYQTNDFAPGGTEAVAAQAGGKYFHIIGNTDLSAFISQGKLRDGLYYVEGQVHLSKGGLSGQITIVATREITISGTGENWLPYTRCLLFFSARALPYYQPAVNVSGGSSRWEGIIFAPLAGVLLSGSGNVVPRGAVVGRGIHLSGNSLNLSPMTFDNCPSIAAVNQPPTADAGGDLAIAFPTNAVTLYGSVTDDGLPNGVWTATWSELSGPAPVVFSVPKTTNSQPVTTATLSEPGTYVLRLTADDGQLASSDDVTVTVDRENHPPVATPQTIVTDEDVPAAITLTGSDPDTNGLSFTIATLPTNGTLSGFVGGSPQGSYTPGTNVNGYDSFTFKVSDGSLESAAATVAITINPVNDAPYADSQSVTNDEDTLLAITLSGSDVENSPLTYTIVNNPTNGALTGTAPNLIYHPATNYFGQDAFTFKVNDGTNDSAPGLVQITLLPVDDAPIVDAGPDQLVVLPTSSVALAGSVTFDLFATVHNVEWTKVGGPGTMTFSDPSNQVTTAIFSQSGIYQLRLTASDSSLSGSDDLVITVDAPPVVQAGPNQTNNLPGNVNLAGSIADDGLPTNNVLTAMWSVDDGPGTVVFSDATATNTSASFSESGIYHLRLTANDGAASASSVVTVLMNRVPVVDAGSDQVLTNLQATLTGTVFDDGVPQGVPLTTKWTQVSGPGTVSFADSNAPATTATFSATGVYGLRLSADDSLAISSDDVTVTIDGAPVVTVSADQTITLPDSASLSATATDDGLPVGSSLTYKWTQLSGPGTVTFTSDSALSTSASFSAAGNYTVQFAANDSLLTSTATTHILVNTAPVAVDQSLTLNEDASIPVTLQATDADGNTLVFSLTTQPAHGVFSGTPPDLTYTPTADYFGSDGFTFTVSDGVATTAGAVSFTILSVNDAPSFAKGADQTVLEDSGPRIVPAWASNISPGPANESGQTVSFLVTSDNPSLFSAAPAVANDGTLTFTPAPNANGVAMVTIRGKDDGGTANGGVDTSAPQTFTITVTAVNDAPSFVKGANQTVLEDSGPQTVSGWATAISAGPANESSQTISFLVASDNAGLFSTAPSVSSNGTLTYTPAANANGVATITVRAQDDGGTANGGVDTSAPQTFTITVTALNDAPSFVKGADQTVLEDSGPQSVPGWATAISAGPANESSQTVSFLVTSDNAALFSIGPVLSTAGTLTYTPATNANGVATVTVRAQEDGGTANGGVDTSAPQTFTITVTPVNDPPSFVKGADQTVLEDSGPQIVSDWATNILAGPANESWQLVSFLVSSDNPTLFSAPPTVSTNGTLTYTPAANANGVATVAVRAQDDGGTADGGIDTSAPQTFTITVTAVNDAPSFVKGADQTVLEDSGPHMVTGWATAISAGPANESSQTVSFLVTSDNAALFSAAPAVSASGTLTYTSATNANGFATVTVRAQDNGGTGNGGVDTSSPQTFTITVTPVNDPPLLAVPGSQTIPEDTLLVFDTNAPITISDIDAGSGALRLSLSVSNGTLRLPTNGLAFITGSNGASGLLVEGTLDDLNTALNGLGYLGTTNFNGRDTLVATIDDRGNTGLGGSLTDTKTVTITVTPVNDAPVANSRTVTTPEDTAVSFTVSATDVDGNGLIYSVVSPASHGALTGTGPNFTYLPATNFNGTDSFTFKVNDGQVDSAPATVTITVTPVNDAPIALNQTVTVLEGQPLPITLQATDPDGDPIQFFITQQPLLGVLSGSGSNRTYTANVGTFGNDSFKFIATDGSLTSAVATVTIQVTPLPRSRTYTTDADFNEGIFFRALVVTNNSIMLRGDSGAFNNLWVADSSKGTIVRIDTDTGEIKGEYQSAPNGEPLNPSRTTVDLDGSVWAANRNGNSVVHIAVPENGLWSDRNHNGVLDTSTGLGDVRPWLNTTNVDSGGGVKSAQDELILHYVKVSSFGTRHVSVDSSNNVWVSGTSQRSWDYISGSSGAILRHENSVGYGGYGGLIDRNGVIWSSRPLMRWDTSKPLTDPSGGNWQSYPDDSYGIGIDSHGNVWVSQLGSGMIMKIAPNGTILGRFNQGSPNAQGVAVGLDDDVWVASSLIGGTTVGHLKNDGTFVGSVKVGNGPTGVAVDTRGKIWVANYYSGNVMRIDPNKGPLGPDGHTSVGLVDYNSPYLGGNLYNYSDMTGSTLRSFPGQSSWTVIFDSTIAHATWGAVCWNSRIYDDGQLQVSFATSDDGANFGADESLPRPNAIPTSVGRYARLKVNFVRSSYSQGPILDDITLGTTGYSAPLVSPAVTVDAGPDHDLQLPLADLLHASVVHNGFLTYSTNQLFQWSKVSGPGDVTFGNTNTATTSARFPVFPTNALYDVRAQTVLSNTTYFGDVHINAIPINRAPWVDVGDTRALRSTNDVLHVDAIATDDGLPANSVLTLQWKKIIGPGNVTFSPTNQASTDIRFTAPGIYLVELAATDGSLSYAADLEVRVQAVCQVNAPSGLAMWWPGNSQTREVVRGNDMTLVNGTGFAQAQCSFGFSFNGTTNYAKAFDHPAMDIGSSDSMTIEFWAKATGSGRFFDWYRGGTYGVFADFNTSGTSLTFHMIDTNGLDHTVSVGNALSSSQFQHVALTYDKGKGQAIVYINGIVTTVANLGSFNPRTTGDLYLSGGPQDPSHFAGVIDELSLYTRALNGEEIYNIFTANFIGKCPVDNNLAPVVSAGNPVSLPGAGTAVLNGTATDDGLPVGSTLYSEWRALSGPAAVTFGNSNSPTTTATFPVPGLYVLQLYADDSVKSATDQLGPRLGAICSVKNIPGLVAWWPANNSSADVFGNGSLIRVNGTSYAPGEVGGSFSLNGANNYLWTPTQPAFNLGQSTNGFTLECWVKGFDQGITRAFLGWNNGTDRGVKLTQGGSGLNIRIWETNGTTHDLTGVGGVFNSFWHHFALAYNRTTGQAWTYLDGVLQHVDTIGSFVAQTDYDFYLGTWPNLNFFWGQVDELSFYQRPLNPQEVYQIFSSGSAGKCPFNNNNAPQVYAGSDLLITGVPGHATLNGVVTDDGLPAGSSLGIQWSKLSGPGAVTFNSPTSAVTDVTFSTNGIYVLQLTADDGEVQSSDLVEVRVETLCTVNDPAGLSAWWPGNGTSLDVIGAQSALLVSGTTYALGEVASSFSLDGANDYVWMAAQPNYNVGKGTNGFTIECWLKGFDQGITRAFLGWNNQTDRGVKLTQGGSGLNIRIWETNGTTHDLTGVGGVFNSSWHHFGLTYDRGTGQARTYLDGVLQHTDTIGSFVPQTDYDLYVGTWPGLNFFWGQVDELSLYQRPLNPQEIYNIYASGSTGKCPNNNDNSPIVSAGPDIFVRGIPGTGTLQGSASDDGLPPGSTLRLRWSKFSGPGNVSFSSPTSAVTTASFSTNGIYILQLTADDGEVQASAVTEARVEALCVINDPAGLSAWWPANGSSLDVIRGQPAILVSGASYAPGEVASSFLLDGANDYVWMPTQTNYNVGQSTNGFTIECWVVGFDQGITRAFLGWNNLTDRGVKLTQGGSGLNIRIWETNGTTHDLTGVGGVFNSFWHHFALTYNRINGQARTYVDGVLQHTDTIGSFVPQTDYDFYVGTWPGLNFFWGQVDELSLYQRALNPQEIYNVYASGSLGKCPNDDNLAPSVYAGPDLFVEGVPGTATLHGQAFDDGLPTGSSLRLAWSKFSGPGNVNFGSPSAAVTTATFSTNGIYVLQLTADDGEAQSSDLVEVRVETLCTINDPAGLAAWWPANGTSLDIMGGQSAILVSGTTYASGEVASSFSLDGANDYVWMPAQTNYDVGKNTNGFTLECWVKGFDQGITRAFLGWNNLTDRGVKLTQGGSGLNIRIWETNGTTHDLTGVGGVFNSFWHHFALTYNRINGQARTYVDGVLQHIDTIGSFVPQTDYDLYVGTWPGLNFFWGQVDELSLYQRALNPEEIYNVYASGSTGKCPNDDNLAPFVYAGPDLFVEGVPGTAALNGVVLDADGFPPGDPLRVQWTKFTGPGNVTFNNPNSATTTASFSAAGIYILQLTANDGEAQTSDLVEVRVETLCVVNDPVGLSAWWPANGTSLDVLGGQSAILVSGTAYAAGEVASSFSLDGANDYVWMPAQTNYDVGKSTNGFTLECWVKGFDQGITRAFMGWNNLAERGVKLTQGGSGLNIRIWETNGTTHDLTGVGGVFNSFWHHFALTYDRINGQARTYVDGVLQHIDSVGSFVPQTDYDFYAGTWPGLNFFWGQIDELSLYQRPLNPQEINNLYVSGAVGKCPEDNNNAPVVFAGPDVILTSTNNSASLIGVATDDGQPSGSTLRINWSKYSGPGNVNFTNTATPISAATFTTNGLYVLQLTADDGDLQSSSLMQVRVGIPCSVLDPAGISAFWPANGTSLDVIGRQAAILVSGATYASAEVATSFSLDGANDYVWMPAQTNYDVGKSTNGFTLECWVKGFDQGITRAFIGWNNLTDRGVKLTQGGSGMSIRIWETNGTTHDLTGVGGVFNGNWHHFALTYDSSSGQARTYVDGVLQHTDTIGSFVPQTDYDFYVGTWPGLNFFWGQVDELSLYARPLAQSEIQAILNTGSAGKCITPKNQAPVVLAGGNHTIYFPSNVVVLSGAAFDDGLPATNTLQVFWSYISGPSTVFFGNTNSASTTVTFTNTGTYTFRLTASDGQYTVTDTASVTVLPDPRIPPFVAVTAPVNGSSVVVPVNGSANFTVAATASALDGFVTNVHFSANGAALGSTAVLPYALQVTNLAPGNYTLSAIADDSNGLSATSAPVSITVFIDNIPPSVTMTSPTNGSAIEVLTNGTTNVTLTASASDFYGHVTQLAFRKNGITVGVFTNTPYSLEVTNLPVGVYSFDAVGSDDFGLSSTSPPVIFTVFIDPGPPTVAITAPTDAGIITAPTNIIGTANSPILQSYDLEYRLETPNGTNAWASLTNGTRSVVNGALGFFDPTLLLNGIYELRLTATDLKGRTASTATNTFITDRNLKVGNFTISFKDLAIPVPGLPIQIIRTYDSRAAAAGMQGDFGIGWTMDIGNVRLQKNRPLGQNWEETIDNGFFPIYRLNPFQDRIVTITFPDGKVQKFRFEPNPMAQILPIDNPQWHFTPLGNTVGSLVPASFDEEDGSFLITIGSVPGPVDLYDLNFFSDNALADETTLNRYPTLFRYTSPEGFKYLIDEIKGLQSVTDTNGNTLIIAPSGLTWTNSTGSNGLGIAFQRDSRGRITNIVDALGHGMTYGYDTNANLRTFVSRDTNSNTFTYDSNHRLLTIADATGTKTLNNTYDGAGRLVVSSDGLTNSISFFHDFEHRRDYVTNRLGFVTIKEYDDHGNVIRRIDPNGATNTFVYDQNDRLLVKSNVNGCACGVIFTYDSAGNRTSETDARGNTTTYTYNEFGKIVTRTEPSGFATTNSYDFKGNLLSTRDSAGQVATFTYDHLGKVISIADAKGVSFFTYNELGFLTNEIDSLGRVTEYTVDPNGNPLSQTITVTRISGFASLEKRKRGWLVAGDPVIIAGATTNTARLVMRYEYTPSGLPLRTLYYDGSSTEITYTNDKPRVTTDALGRKCTDEYNENGLLIRRTCSDCEETFEYDAESQLVAKTDKRGYRTTFEYDGNGKLIRTTFPDGSQISATYYLDGSLLSETSKSGEVTTYGLDADGNRVTVSDRSGTAHYTYNYKNLATSKVDPLGRTNLYEYDALGRNTAVTYPDGSRKTATFFGKLVTSETDQNGSSTLYEYDPSGRLITMTNAVGGVTRYTYDDQDNKTSETDPLGRTTYFEYDLMKHLTRTIYADDSKVGSAYDLAGRLIARTNQLGDVTLFDYNNQDNVTSVTDPLGRVIRYTYDCGNNKLTQTDPDSQVTHFTYDALSRLTNTLFPCGTTEIRTYDLPGRMVAQTDPAGKTTRFSYDIRNQLIGITNSLGQVSAFGYDAVGNRTNEVDALGHTTRMDYDSLNRAIRTTFPDSTTEQYGYDPVGRIVSQTDQRGKASQFAYDALGRLASMTNALAQVTSFVYDPVGNRTNQIDSKHQVTSFEFNLMNRRTRTVLPDGSVTSVIYDKLGLPVSETDALGHTTVFDFDADGERTSVKDALSHTTQYTYDSMGRVSSVTDANNKTTSFGYDCHGKRNLTTYPDNTTRSAVYDGDGRLISSTDQNNHTTTFAYDDLGHLTTQTDPLGRITSFAYDSLGRLTSRTDAKNHTTTFTYDELGRLTKTTYADSSFRTATFDSKGRRTSETDPRGYTTTFAYDDLDRLIAQTNALGQVTQYAYDELNRLVAVTDANNRATSFQYDPVGRLTRTTYADATFRENQYDALGRRVSETDQAGVTHQYAYDPVGRLIAVTNALQNATFYNYDPVGRLIAQIDANDGTTSYEYDSLGRRTRRILPAGQSETLGYDPAGNLIARTNLNGHVTSYSYDPLNRLTQRTPDSALAASGSVPETFAYDAVGLRTNMTDASGTTAYSYDVRDRLVVKITPQGTLSYAYDPDSDVTNIVSSNPNGTAVIYEYDPLDRLSAVNDLRVGRTICGYDPVGNLQTWAYPNLLTNSYAYDALNRLTNLLAFNQQHATVSQYGYVLGPAGHRLSASETVATNGVPSTLFRSYAYDPLYRLTNETVTTSLAAPSLTPTGGLAYIYDAVGNRLERASTLTAIASRVYSYDSGDHLASDVYDANGNTKSAQVSLPVAGTLTTDYDFEDRITHATTPEGKTIDIIYDGDGNRVRKTVSTATETNAIAYLVDDRNPSGYAQVLEEIVSSNGAPAVLMRTYTYGQTLISEDQLLETNWVTSFYGVDGHGSVRYLTDASAHITDTFDYDAFGNLIGRTGSTPNNYLFAGEQYDQDLGLYYLRARYADPDRGRFWTMDTFEGFAADPRSLHKYTFNQNDPVNRFDPSGHESLAESAMVADLAPMVTGTLLSLFAGINNYSFGLAGGDTLKFTSRAEAYMIDSLAPGPGWKFGKPNFWATARGAPFMLSWNPNICQSAKACWYECIPFDEDVPVYGPGAKHPIFEMQQSDLYKYLEAGTIPLMFTLGAGKAVVDAGEGLYHLGKDVLGTSAYAWRTYLDGGDTATAEEFFGTQYHELLNLGNNAYGFGRDALYTELYLPTFLASPDAAEEIFGEGRNRFQLEAKAFLNGFTGGEGTLGSVRAGYTFVNLIPFLGELGRVKQLARIGETARLAEGARALTAASKAGLLDRLGSALDASKGLWSDIKDVCKKPLQALEDLRNNIRNRRPTGTLRPGEKGLHGERSGAGFESQPYDENISPNPPNSFGEPNGPGPKALKPAEVATKAEELGAPEILNASEVKTLKLSEDWKTTQLAKDADIVYVLRDADTGELLKVGKTEAETFTDRFSVYQKAGERTGRNLEVDVITFEKGNFTAESIESQIRANLEEMGHSLPWDNTGQRLGRLGPGVPGASIPRRLRDDYEWDYDLETLVPKK